MTTNSRPPPIYVPPTLLKDPEQSAFFEALTNSLYELWYSLGGQSGGIIPGDRITSDLSGNNTDALAEGSINFYYTETRFNTSLATKTSDDITEGSTNLYYTTARQEETLAISFFMGL